MLLLCLFSGFIAAFALRKLQKHGKQGNFHVFWKMLHKKTSGLFVRFDGRTVPRRAYTLYIYKNVPRVPLATSSVTIKKTNRFPFMLLLYRIHAFLSSISGIVHFPEYDGLHKLFQQHDEPNVWYVSGNRFRLLATLPLYSSPKKLTISRLYCRAKKLTIIQDGSVQPRSKRKNNLTDQHKAR